MAQEARFLPLLIDMSGRKVLIFGGGMVGERKAQLFTGHADLTIISREFTPGILSMQEEKSIELIEADAGSMSNEELDAYMEGAFLVIPATSSRSINERISSAARAKQILTNLVDAIGDVTVPSIIQRGELTISISTSGTSPAFSKFLRQRLEEFISPQFADMIRVQEGLRAFLKEHVPEQHVRKEMLWYVLESNEVWEALGASYEKGYNVALDIIKEKLNGKSNNMSGHKGVEEETGWCHHE